MLGSARTVGVYEIDHIPIGHPDLSRLAAGFEALGFSVSGICRYQSPDHPGESWTCRAVFLEHGWLDLQLRPDRPPLSGAVPHSCLFRAPSLAGAISELPTFRTGPITRLVRDWEGEEAPQLGLRWMSLRERVAPLVLALVDYPAADKDVERPKPRHPNSATRILGLSFGDAPPGPAAEEAARRLSLSGFKYLPRRAFEKRFGTPDGPLVALRIEVASLDDAAGSLRKSGLAFGVADQSIMAPAQGELSCGVEFIQAGER
jgi:hypothetical protein